MSRRQKIVVVAVFVLLALLYIGAAAGGGGSGQGNASGHPGGIVGWLGRVVGQPPDAARSDLTAPCLAGGTLTVKSSCVLSVAKSNVGTRRVKLHATDAVTITSRAPQGDQDITADVKAGTDVNVTVDGKGGGIAIVCASTGATCTVTLS